MRSCCIGMPKWVEDVGPVAPALKTRPNLFRLISLVCAFAAATAFAHPPAGIAVDDKGRVYFMQVPVGVWMIDEHGKLGMAPGTGYHHIELDPDGKFLKQHWPSFPDGVIRAVGTNPAILCVSSFPVAIGRDGALYYPEANVDFSVTDPGPRGVHIRRLAPGGTPTKFADLPDPLEIGEDGTVTVAQWIHGLALGPKGDLFYTEKDGIRRIDVNGNVTPIIEKIKLAECVRPPAIADVREGVFLRGLDVADDGTIYAASAGCSALLKVTQAGEVSVALQERDGWAPTDVEAVGNKLYVHEFYYTDPQQDSNWRPRVRLVAADGTVTTLATAPEAPKRPAESN